jgi:N-acetylneuraminic acid mutarotase
MAPAAAASTDGKIYVMGGYNRASNSVRATAYSFTPGAANWATLSSPMTSPRVEFGAAVATDGTIYAVGGRDNLSNELQSAEYFVPGGSGWTTIPTLSAPRVYHGVAFGGDARLHVIGGREGGSSSAGFLNANDTYDPVTKKWGTSAALPVGRQQMAVATGPDGRVYVLGGATGPVSGQTNDVTVFGP